MGDGYLPVLTSSIEMMMPEFWERVPVPDDRMVVIAEKGQRDGRFRANMVVVVRESTETVAELGARSVAEALAFPGWSHVYSTLPWGGAGVGRGTGGGTEGRVVDFIYEASGVYVSVTRSGYVTGTHAVEITASCDIVERLIFEEFFNSIASSVLVRDSVPPQAELLWVKGPDVMEIALDSEAMLQVDSDVPKELLTRIPPLQPFPVSEMRMSRAAWEQLWKCRRRGLFSQIRKDSEAFQELVTLGLIDAYGRVTPEGAKLVRVRADAKLLFGATADSGGLGTSFSGWYVGLEVLVAADVVGAHGTPEVSIHRTTPNGALALLVSWMRIAPAWVVAKEDGGEHDTALVTRRIDAAPGEEPALPDDAGWALTRAWNAGEWTRYVVACPTTDTAHSYIRTGDVGWFSPEPLPDDRLRLRNVVSVDVMRDVVELFLDSVETTRR